MLINIDEELLKELIALGDRLTEDRLYEIVVQELEQNIFDSVAQAKALEEAEGDEKKARAFYTKHRVRRIRDLISSIAVVKRAQEEEDRLQAEKKRFEEEERLKQVKEIERKYQKIGEDAEIREKNQRFVGWLIYIVLGLFMIAIIFS